ncbi:19314_t:CDS:2, partial [Cetraspora pellucida]
MSSIKKRKSKYSTDSNSTPNSNENSCPENAIYISNNETSNETLSDENISTSSNSSTGNFQSHLNAHRITKLTQINSIAAQPTIDEMFQNAVKQNPRQKESIEHALVEWIVTNSQPFYILQSESFVKLIHTLNPYYELPSNKQIKAHIHQSYNNSIEYLKTLLVTELKTCSLTCNLWTAHSKNSYLGITCHFINSNYELKEIILAVKYVPYSHDAITIKTELENVINDWNLFEKSQEMLKVSKEKISSDEKMYYPTMSDDSDSKARKDAKKLKSIMITKDEWIVLEELTILLAPFAKLLNLTSASIEEIDLMDASDVFDNIEEDIVDLDEKFATITIANDNVIKLNQPQNTDGL